MANKKAKQAFHEDVQIFPHFYQNITIEPMSIGENVLAIEIWKNNTPLALVALKDNMGNMINSRLDIQKNMFIDPLPGTVDPEQVQKLSQKISTL